MLMKQILEIFDLLDSPSASGEAIYHYMKKKCGKGNITVQRMEQDGRGTDFVGITIPGKQGKLSGGSAPSLGVVGRLGGLGARPEMTGFVSDGDGALTALSVAAKVLDMNERGDYLNGDLYVCTHICPDAPTMPHKPVPFMGSPVDMSVMNEMEVYEEMDAVLSIDTTRGNRIINHCGFAISPTVKEGYILRISEDLLDIMQITTGKHPYTFAVTTQDITPYGNGIYHLNSILQPSTATQAPVVGVAITTETMVPGCATGATHLADVEATARFTLEVAKSFGNGTCAFFDENEFNLLKGKYGSMRYIQTMGR